MFLVSLILASLSFTLFFPPYCASLSFHKGLAVEALPVLPQVSSPFTSPTRQCFGMTEQLPIDVLDATSGKECLFHCASRFRILSLREKYLLEVKIVLCFNLHFFFVISKAEYLSWFAGHLYILSQPLACC